MNFNPLIQQSAQVWELVKYPGQRHCHKLILVSLQRASAGCAADLPRLEKGLRIVLNRCPPTGPDVIHRKVHSSALQMTEPQNVCSKEVEVTLNKLDMTHGQIYLTNRNIVIDARLATSKDSTVRGNANAEKELVSYSSDDTEAYWPLDPKKQILMFPNVIVMHPVRTSNQKTTWKFNIQVRGIRHRRNHYYVKCIVTGCNKTFNKILNWNLHHHLTHKTKVKCRTCGRKFDPPSSHRVHQNIHAAPKFKCALCQKNFAFNSGLHQHINIHNKSRLHKCFHGSCKKAFKWPQDLARHIQCHINPKWECDKCNYVFKEKHLLA